MLPDNGTLIADRYRVGELIGRGNMGVVYGGMDEKRNQAVAIKFLVIQNEWSRSLHRFFRGARLAKKIEHPHVVTTRDFGLIDGETQSAWLVMDLVDGQPLSALDRSRLSVATMVGLACQCLNALAHMHARGILHRDIKPDNLLVETEADGSLSIRITDFGLAAAFDKNEEVSEVTMENVVVGTAAYMSPEQASSSTLVTPASDLYALGVVLYELFEGHRPFKGSPLSILLQKVREPAPQITASVSRPQPLLDTVMKLVATNPMDRFNHAADVLKALDQFAGEPRLHPSAQDENESIYEYAPTMVNNEIVDLATIVQTEGEEEPGSRTANVWGRESVIGQMEQLAHQAQVGAGSVLSLASVLEHEASAMMEHLTLEMAEQGLFTPLRGGFQEVAGTEGGLRQALEGHWGTLGLPRHALIKPLTQHLERHQTQNEGELEGLLQFLRPEKSQTPFTEGNQNTLFAVFFRTLRRLAKDRPICLSLAEIDHDEALARAFLEYALFELTYAPFPLLILTSQTVPEDGIAPWSLAPESSTYRGRALFEIALPPIERGVLSEALRVNAGIDAESADHIASLSGGSPMIARQLAIAHDKAMSSASSDREADRIASLATTRFQERLAQLALHPIKRDLMGIIECIAILGGAAEYQVLRTMCSDHITGDFDDGLGELMDRALISSRPNDFEEVIFLTPASLAEVLRTGLSTTRNQALHGSAIAARVKTSTDNGTRMAGAIGDHYESMGQDEQAIQWWQRAVNFELEVGDPLRGAEWGARLIEKTDIDSEQAVACAIQVGKSLLDSGHLSRAISILEPTIDASSPNNALLIGEVLADLYENSGQAELWKALVSRLTKQVSQSNESGQRAFLRTRAMYSNSYGQSRAALADAVQALNNAPPGEETQRAAQRAVYCCLAMGKPSDGEPYARKALEASGSNSDLRVRSLRALGTVLTWLNRGPEAVEMHESTLSLCREKGFFARIPIAYHDLGDAHRMCGNGLAAEEAYAMALHNADELALGHTQALVKVKQVMCALTDSRTGGIFERLRHLAPEALEAGLGLAVPFCHFLAAWAHTINGHPKMARLALEQAGDLSQISVDPQVPAIIEFIEKELTERTI